LHPMQVRYQTALLPDIVTLLTFSRKLLQPY
jgi:hypothetical protein